MWAKQSSVNLGDKAPKPKVNVNYFYAFHRKDSSQLVDGVGVVIGLLVKLAIETQGPQSLVLLVVFGD